MGVGRFCAQHLSQKSVFTSFTMIYMYNTTNITTNTRFLKSKKK